MSNRPTRLLEKYDLLLDQLDFEHIRQCNDGRQVENILKVLRSGEEGYFPQLTAFAEERLRVLRPDSKLLRKEVPLATRHTMPEEQWNSLCSQLNRWEDEMKTLSSEIRSVELPDDDGTLPPVRKIIPDADQQPAKQRNASEKPPAERIRSCDYARWDQYDPETELLKMDLDEERHRELVRANNRKNVEPPKIVELPPEVKLSEQEKQVLAENLRLKGNDFFRAKEFKEAIREYSSSLELLPTATCFNNRAMANIKLHRYKEAIADCDQCLLREPENVKALLRKGQALKSNNNPREAYKVYCEVLRLEPSNSIALSSMAELRRQLPDLPPPNAFRMTIEEVSNSPVEPKEDEIDFSALVKPKKIIKDRLPTAIKQLKKDTASVIRQGAQEQAVRSKQPITLQRDKNHAQRTPLIEEL
ncbi:sperm-associated antigen 1 [Anopheles ziemanni]|uniref:sperm-associated antigen 1 n=1 Tax=Anopheles coustani TaxID=139045 RepID=UPI00265B29EF|nr:sperm-associated antigen 1 [Anopheles coustani]XP_058170379.1 sperm-associated antigen 1 [Anopheles ziemanni]